MGKLENINIKRKKGLKIRRPLDPYTVLPGGGGGGDNRPSGRGSSLL